MGHERRSDRIIRALIVLCTLGACGVFVGQGVAQLAAAELPRAAPVAPDVLAELAPSGDRVIRDPHAVLSSALFAPETPTVDAPPESIALPETEAPPQHCEGVRVVGLITGDVESTILSAAGARSAPLSVGDSFDGRRVAELSEAGVTLEDSEGRSCAVGMFGPREVAAESTPRTFEHMITVANRPIHRYPSRRRARTRS